MVSLSFSLPRTCRPYLSYLPVVFTRPKHVHNEEIDYFNIAAKYDPLRALPRAWQRAGNVQDTGSDQRSGSDLGVYIELSLDTIFNSGSPSSILLFPDVVEERSERNCRLSEACQAVVLAVSAVLSRSAASASFRCSSSSFAARSSASTTSTSSGNVRMAAMPVS